MTRLRLLAALSLTACTSSAVAKTEVAGTAELTLPALIGEHMVLQRDTTVALWGWAAPDAEVVVDIGWLRERRTTTADADGRFEVRVRTDVPSPGPWSLAFESGGERIGFEDVLLGEVWVCSGQSNMEWSMDRTADGYPSAEAYEAEVAAASYPQIRFFEVPRRVSLAPETQCAGSWSPCTPERVRGFSAVAYFYGRELHAELGVPIGLVSSNWGGTPAESWTRAETLRAHGGFDAGLDQLERERAGGDDLDREYEEALADWQEAFEASDAGAAGWHEASWDTEGWETAELPAAWSGTELQGFDGTVWYRRAVELPDAWAGRELTLELGAIDDEDVTWFAGERVGGLEGPGHWQTPRSYSVPASLVRAGRAHVAVRVYDTGGEGGFTSSAGALRIGPSDEDPEGWLSLAGTWRWQRGLDQSKVAPRPSRGGVNQHTPSGLYNGMIAPLIPYGIRGVIWYQGESNRMRAAQYRSLFPAMIGDWRHAWGQGAFPFYYVQIAPFGYGGDTGQAAELREAQLRTLSVPNTGMAVTMDIGDPRDIHPRNKLDVGLRLARWALARTYGREDVVPSGPLPTDHAVEGGAIRIHFEYGQGLAANGGELQHFEVAGEDGVFHPAVATIDGETVLVSSDAVSNPVRARYAWGAADAGTLVNAAGLPAPSFRVGDE